MKCYENLDKCCKYTPSQIQEFLKDLKTFAKILQDTSG